MDLKLLKMLCKDSKQHHVIFHEFYSVSSLLCIAQNVRFEIPYKVLYFETPFLMIFKYYAWASYDFTSFEAFSDTFHSGQIRSPLSLRIVVRDFVLVSFTYAVDFSFFIGTTQEESTINCGGFVDPNYFLFCPSYVTTSYSPQEIFSCTAL